MSKPKRIQRIRAKGWKMPANAIYVGRPTVWGNPYVVGSELMNGETLTAEKAVELYEQHLADNFSERDIRHCLPDKDLADRMRGEGPIVTAWPRHERVLTSAERYELQAQLVRRGFDIGGEPNGRINAKSRSAIRNFQTSQGLVPDGFATAAMLDLMRQR